MLTPQTAPAGSEHQKRWIPWSLAVGGASLLLLAATVGVGADAGWLVALGDIVDRTGHIPTGVPFAAAPSHNWVNVPVLGEWVFARVHSLGVLGLPSAQLVADAVVLVLISRGARRLRAAEGASAAVVALVVLGGLPAFGVVRAQLMSLIPFVVTVALMRSEQLRPSRRVWLVVPIVAVWGNLHGAVLVGVALTACYLIVSRLSQDPPLALLVLVASVAALWANPAGPRTMSYYLAVMRNEASRRGTGLWAPIDVRSPFDQLLLLAALILSALLIRAKRPAWEYLTTAGLAVATATSARYGIWLLLFCAAPAAAALTDLAASRRSDGRGSAPVGHVRLAIAAPLVALTIIAAGVVLGYRVPPLRAGERDVAAIRQYAAGRVILAPEPLAEALAVDGARVWLSNPIDAFSREDQAAFLDFLDGRGASSARAFDAAEVVVVVRGSKSAELASHYPFTFARQVAGFDVLVRR